MIFFYFAGIVTTPYFTTQPTYYTTNPTYFTTQLVGKVNIVNSLGTIIYNILGLKISETKTPNENKNYNDNQGNYVF